MNSESWQDWLKRNNVDKEYLLLTTWLKAYELIIQYNSASSSLVPQQQYAATHNFCISLLIQLPWSNQPSRRMPHRPAHLVPPQIAIPQSRQIWVCSLWYSATFYVFTDVASIIVAGLIVPLSDHVKLLGVTLNNRLTMDKRVNKVSRACFIIYVHCNTSDQPSPPKTPTWLPACSVVGSRLDYANAVLYGVSSKNITRLQRIQNSLAHCVVDLKLHCGSNALLTAI